MCACPYNCNNHPEWCDGSRCTCNSAFTGPYCQWPLETVSANTPVNQNVTVGQWVYFTFSVVQPSTFLRADVSYLGGPYPVIYIQKDSIPTASHYLLANATVTNYAAKSLLVPFPQQGMYFVGISSKINSNINTHRDNLCQFSFAWSQPSPCPKNCNGQGNCTSSGCQCTPPYTWSDCSMYLATISSGQSYGDTVNSGTFQYIEFPTTSLKANALTISLQISPTSSISKTLFDFPTASFPLFLRKGKLPSLAEYDYTYSATDLQNPVSIFMTNPLDGTPWYFAVWGFGQPGSSFDYTLNVSAFTSCLNDCSGAGNCTNGKCVCEPGYSGARPDGQIDCSIYEQSIFNSQNPTPDVISPNTMKHYLYQNSPYSDITFQIEFGNFSLPFKLIMYARQSLRPNHVFFEQRVVCDSQSPTFDNECSLFLIKVEPSTKPWYFSVYYPTNYSGVPPIAYGVTVHSQNDCPNDCNAVQSGSFCEFDGTCSCTSNWINAPDCSLFWNTVPWSGWKSQTKTIEPGQWHYFSLSLSHDATFLIVNVTVEPLQGPVRNFTPPVKIFIRKNALPTNYEWDGIVSESAATQATYGALQEQVTLVGKYIVTAGNWYIAVHSDTKIFTDIVYYMIVYFDLCQDCACPPDRVGENCEFPFKGIPTADKNSGQAIISSLNRTNAWDYYWIYNKNPEPLLIFVEEISVEKGNTTSAFSQGHVWVFVTNGTTTTAGTITNILPTPTNSMFWNVSVSLLHAVFIPSDIAPGNWTIGVMGSPLLLNRTVRYSIMILSGCSAYEDCEKCTRDPGCGWCWDDWQSAASGTCVSISEVVPSLCLHYDPNSCDVASAVSSNSAKGLAIGALVGTGAIVLAIGLLLFFHYYGKKLEREKYEPIVSTKSPGYGSLSGREYRSDESGSINTGRGFDTIDNIDQFLQHPTRLLAYESDADANLGNSATNSGPGKNQGQTRSPVRSLGNSARDTGDNANVSSRDKQAFESVTVSRRHKKKESLPKLPQQQTQPQTQSQAQSQTQSQTQPQTHSQTQYQTQSQVQPQTQYQPQQQQQQQPQSQQQQQKATKYTSLLKQGFDQQPPGDDNSGYQTV